MILKTFNKLLLGTFFYLAIVLTACDNVENITPPSQYPITSYSSIFEGFWNGVNNNYVFWSIDTVDWDKMYTRYQPKFAKLSVNDPYADQQAVKYFEEMTSNLIDSHFNLSFYYSGNQFSPAEHRKAKLLKEYPDSLGVLLPPGFFTQSIYSILDSTTAMAGVDTLSDGYPMAAVTGTFLGEVLYFYCNSFSFSDTISTQNTLPVLNKFLQNINIAETNPSYKGIIIDVRNNRGGSVDHLSTILGQMLQKPLKIGETRTKVGNGRLDYSPWMPAKINPPSGSLNYTKPLIVIADHFSVSLAEVFAMTAKAMPNGLFIGETTWGANGPLTTNSETNGGQFTVGELTSQQKPYMDVYTSSAQFRYLNGESYEGKGVPPDVWVPITLKDLNNGVDAPLFTALKRLLN